MKNVNSPKNDYLCKASDRKTNRVNVGWHYSSPSDTLSVQPPKEFSTKFKHTWLRSYKKDSKYEMHHKGNEPKC